MLFLPGNSDICFCPASFRGLSTLQVPLRCFCSQSMPSPSPPPHWASRPYRSVLRSRRRSALHVSPPASSPRQRCSRWVSCERPSCCRPTAPFYVGSSSEACLSDNFQTSTIFIRAQAQRCGLMHLRCNVLTCRCAESAPFATNLSCRTNRVRPTTTVSTSTPFASTRRC